MVVRWREQDTGQAKVGFWLDANIEDFNFKNEKSHVDEVYSFQIFVDSSTDSNQFFKNWSFGADINYHEYIQHENIGPIYIP